MKIFKIDDCDYVYSNSLEEAKKWYSENIMGDYEFEIEEANINSEIWYGFDLHNDRYDKESLSEFLKANSHKTFSIKYAKWDFDCFVRITFEELLKWIDPKETQIVVSTEV